MSPKFIGDHVIVDIR